MLEVTCSSWTEFSLVVVMQAAAESSACDRRATSSSVCTLDQIKVLFANEPIPVEKEGQEGHDRYVQPNGDQFY